jgi:hypothetical protein
MHAPDANGRRWRNGSRQVAKNVLRQGSSRQKSNYPWALYLLLSGPWRSQAVWCAGNAAVADNFTPQIEGISSRTHEVTSPQENQVDLLHAHYLKCTSPMYQGFSFSFYLGRKLIPRSGRTLSELMVAEGRGKDEKLHRTCGVSFSFPPFYPLARIVGPHDKPVWLHMLRTEICANLLIGSHILAVDS